MDNEYKAIFELNNKTPLFARVAADAIEENKFEEAISILENGIELFENYPTPYFLLGKALAKLGKNNEAKEALDKGNYLLNNSETFDYYLNLISENNSIDIIDEKEVSTSVEDITENVVNADESNFEGNDDDNLVELADKLKDAKIKINHDNNPPPPIETNEPENDEEFKPLKGLVSETLATIYFNQANYKEAKAIYETLIEIQPEHKEYFESKLAKIEAKMRTRKSEND